MIREVVGGPPAPEHSKSWVVRLRGP